MVLEGSKLETNLTFGNFTQWLLTGLEPALSHMTPETFTIAPTEINIDQTMLLAERVQLQWTVTLVTHLHTSC